MAGNSVIGALRVNLGLDSAQFTTGLKTATGALSKFGIQTTVSLESIVSAVTRVTAALPKAIKASIDHADALSKSAQKAGTTVEALSRLEYAAKLSDVSLEGLTGGLGKLSKSMLDASTNTKGTAASAFAALGISVTDASGKLRDTDAVFNDLADSFSRLPDGATKTALSMQVLGKAGAELIPLLNGGSAELHRFGAESDATGNTINTKTAKAAEEFNDTLTKLQSVLTGIANKLTESVLPFLQQFADYLLTLNPQILQWGTVLGSVLVVLVPVSLGIGAIGTAAGIAVPVVVGLTGAVVGLNTALLALAGTLGAPAVLAGLALLASTTATAPGEDDLVKKLGLTKPKYGGVPITINGGGAADQGPSSSISSGLALAGGATLFADLDPAGKKIDTVTDKLGTLKEGLAAIGPVAADAQQAMADGFDTAVGALGNLSGALSSAFKDSKAFAVSTAILQGLQGVAYALGSSAPPWNFINAAAVGIEAAANVASILSTSENSTSMPGSATSSGSAAAAANPGSSINLTIRGSGLVSTDDIVSQLTQSIADGGQQAFIKVTKAAMA